MWERTLQDLIRGLRANKKDEAKFIAKAVDEIRHEIKTDDMELKAGAVLKLTYLDMLGYDMSWASFHVVEVMSSPKFHLKSVGYLAAAQSFEQDTDVLMLTTNLLKKDLSSTPADVAVALNGLSLIVTPDLARDITPELIRMLSHSRAHIRKRAILVLYNVLRKNPEAIHQARPRLEERLDDSDPSVIAATVNVICELARKYPKDYLSLAPQLFHLLTTSSNNWMLIKIIKLFGSLCPHEPRLVKKLQPPITELISTTQAISLLYECVHTCIIGGMLQGISGDSLARMCVSKLAAFIEDADQNLKYISLLALVKIVPTHPHLVAEYQETIFSSINDQDISIRMRALDLISAMVNRYNLQSIVQQVLSHLVTENSTPSLPTAAQTLSRYATTTTTSGNSESYTPPSQSPAYRLVLSQRILSICSQSTYENVTNFEWYLSVLVDLAHVAHVDVGAEIRDQLVDIVGRVRGVRRFAVRLMYSLLSDYTMLRNAEEEGNCTEVLWAAAWICGEYCEELSEPQKLLQYILLPEIANLTPDITAVYIQAATKIFGRWATELAENWDDDDLPEVKRTVENILTRTKELSSSPHIEVQERAANSVQLFTFILADLNAFQTNAQANLVTSPDASSSSLPSLSSEPRFPKSLFLIQPLFAGHQMNPVAVNAQANVPVPEGLDLDAWIVPPPPDKHIDDQLDQNEIGGRKSKKSKKAKEKDKEKDVNGKKSKKRLKDDDRQKDVLLTNGLTTETETPEELAERERRKAERRAQLRDDPYYIIDDKPTTSTKTADDVESIPVVHLEGLPSLTSELLEARPPLLKTQSETFSNSSYVIEKDGEMPDGVDISPSPPAPTEQAETRVDIAAPTPVQPTSFTPYEVPEDAAETSNPQPIKVTRSKKKTTGKKKRVQDLPSNAV